MIRSNLTELRLRKARELRRKNFTLEELAEATGISISTLSNIGAGKGKAVYMETMEVLCAFFGCGVGDLWEYIPEEEQSIAKTAKPKPTVKRRTKTPEKVAA